ncbi:hypothetical protein RclHR1_08310004 [Rhizophagus clarus]|uniref:Uncharacterized protein n=1 Tax=Rhizophagus clarus TaxID=94130 RepID=A0A2Z6S0J4_9GLOM|nr:hypothetical protein RclHR1_08310004 [Rhizophagus clarus]GES91092.1 hypothetical protein RCL_e26436_RclHR1_08310004 [Rhizophagus clarus]
MMKSGIIFPIQFQSFQKWIVLLISTGFSRAPSTAPSTATVSLNKDQLLAAKKVKLYRPKRKNIKLAGCMWQYMIQENEYDICQIPVMNMQNKEVCVASDFCMIDLQET